MDKDSKLVKLAAGVTMMFSVFLLLFSVSEYELFSQGVKFAFRQGDEFTKTAAVSTPEPPSAPTPIVMIEGIFDLGSESDAQEETEENGLPLIKHYRALYSAKIKNSGKPPRLKLQVFNGQREEWKDVEISDVDRENNAIYFLFKTENEESISIHDYYTGAYQMIFE